MSDRVRVLVVEGNDRGSTEKMRALGAKSYGEQYAALLESMDSRIKCDIARPSEEGSKRDLKGYAGVAWTGSAMSAYEQRSEVANQIELAQRVFDEGLPVFGSCWGLQIAAEALGGKVRANPKGREIGIVPDITIAPGAEDHPMFERKPQTFAVLAVHRDEVEELPTGARVLASNDTSEVQAMTVEGGGVDFWGVQYHPEFDFKTIAIIYRRLVRLLISEGTCKSEAEVEAQAAKFEKYAENSKSLPAEVRDPTLRQAEIRNWLNEKVLNA